ncbi:MAG: glycosyltransferase, partial [Clostridia bacterium]|nr:glycosyltransferase [Clostridia bacterium]
VVICCPKHKNKTFKSEKYFVLATDSLYVKNQGYDLGFPQLDLVFQKLISLLKIDLIHVQSPFNMGNFGVSLAKKRKIPCLTTFHSQFKQNFQNAVKNEPLATLLTRIVMGIYQRSTVAVTMNNFARNLMKEYGLKKQVELIPNATNLKPKQFDEKFERDLLKKHKIDKDKFNIIFIGRFVEVKNVYFILDSIIELYKTNKDFNFIFLGYGPEQNKMQKICKENGLENIVKFTGKIDSEDEKAILIKNSNLLFFPSVYDTDGIVRIECACYSVPTLCIEETGVASSLKDNVNGYIEKYSKEAFAKRMDVLIKNKEETKKVGERAFKEIYITWEGVCEKLFNLYEETLKNFLTKNIKKKSKNKNAKTEK